MFDDYGYWVKCGHWKDYDILIGKDPKKYIFDLNPGAPAWSSKLYDREGYKIKILKEVKSDLLESHVSGKARKRKVRKHKNNLLSSVEQEYGLLPTEITSGGRSY